VDWASAAPRDDLAPLLESLERETTPADALVVKQSRARRVIRADLPSGGAAYLKVYFAAGGLDRVRALVGRSRARQEYTNLRRLADLGIAAVEPLCRAERKDERGRREALLVTRALEDAVSLADELARADSVRRDDLLLAAGRLVRELHDRALFHRDLHCGNVLVTRPGGGQAELVLVDVQKLWRVPLWLPRVLREPDLGQLYDDLRPLVGSEARAQLLVGYAGTDDAGLRERVTRAAERRRRTRLRSRGRRCVLPSTGFRVERHGRYRVYRRADVPVDSVLTAVEAQRDRVEDLLGGPPAGPPAEPSARGQGAAEAAGPARGPVAVRAFPGRSFAELLRQPLRGHCGMRAWRGAHALLLRGFDTPAPLALVEERGAMRVRRSWVLTRFEEQEFPSPSEADCARRRLRAAEVRWRSAELPRITRRVGVSAGAGGEDGLLIPEPEALRFGR
jgi:hypothetical protein